MLSQTPDVSSTHRVFLFILLCHTPVFVLQFSYSNFRTPIFLLQFGGRQPALAELLAVRSMLKRVFSRGCRSSCKPWTSDSLTTTSSSSWRSPSPFLSRPAGGYPALLPPWTLRLLRAPLVSMKSREPAQNERRPLRGCWIRFWVGTQFSNLGLTSLPLHPTLRAATYSMLEPKRPQTELVIHVSFQRYSWPACRNWDSAWMTVAGLCWIVKVCVIFVVVVFNKSTQSFASRIPFELARALKKVTWSPDRNSVAWKLAWT